MLSSKLVGGPGFEPGAWAVQFSSDDRTEHGSTRGRSRRCSDHHGAAGANGDPRRSLAVPTGADDAEVGQRGSSYSEANK
jgi:hypothetical protein